MKVIATELPGVLLLEPQVFGDARGFFMETWQATRYREAGMPERFVQDNHSRSRRGVLRGLHYQLTQPQGKLVWVMRGAVFDVAVDVRCGSPSFGRWYGCVLDDLNHCQLYIPPGVRSRLLRAVGGSGLLLQMHRLLPSILGARHRLGRS